MNHFYNPLWKFIKFVLLSTTRLFATISYPVRLYPKKYNAKHTGNNRPMKKFFKTERIIDRFSPSGIQFDTLTDSVGRPGFGITLATQTTIIPMERLPGVAHIPPFRKYASYAQATAR